MSRLASVLGAALLAGSVLSTTIAAAPAAAQAPTASDVVTIETLSNRADLVSGGDVLVEVRVSDGSDLSTLRVDVDGRDVTDAFAVRSDGRYLGVVDGLELGTNVLRAELPNGHGATLAVTNHPLAGPVFSGPHILPWACSGESLDEHCNREPTYTLLYKPRSGGGFQTYVPGETNPEFVATTTTDEGVEVPFIVREEKGVIARDEYRIAVLYQPDAEWTAVEPQQQWNGKVVITHGQSCDTSYGMGASPDVRLEQPLAAGFAVISHALDHAGHNCNIATQAESLVMTKEYLADNYGQHRYTIGTGCSGGALAQQQVANAYPGVYQGISPACSFADAWSTAMQYIDYYLMREYFEQPQKWGAPWTPAQISAAYGHPNYANPVTFTEVIPNSGEPTRSCPGVPSEDVYDEDTNPDGVRCTLQDYMVNIFGRREVDGFANRPWDNVGVQYGLKALLDGTLLPLQFVDLNTKLGGLDIDLDPQAERVEADLFGVEAIYRSGAVNMGNHLNQTAIIDLRGPDPGAFHDTYRTDVMRARLVEQHGNADNQLLWEGSVALLGDATYRDAAIFALDRWLANVEADTRDIPLSQKLIENKPEDLSHRCTNGSGQDVPQEYCDQVVEDYSSPRIEAGMPLSENIVKCQLVPIEDFDYGDVVFTDEQMAALKAAFPTGVCDYTKPGVHQQDTVAWQTYATGPGGTPLGAAPVSVGYGPAVLGVVAAAEPLPATGGGMALAGLAAMGLSVATRIRRRG